MGGGADSSDLTPAQAGYANELGMGNLAGVTADAPVVERLVTQPLARQAGLPLTDDWDCLRVPLHVAASWTVTPFVSHHPPPPLLRINESLSYFFSLATLACTSRL